MEYKYQIMNNIKTYEQHINEAIEIYTGYRSGENGEIIELDDEPVKVWIAKNLVGANMSRDFLRNAQLNDMDLSHVAFYKADLTSANLSGSNLTGAIFKDADLTFADFTNANLSGAKGLELAKNIESARFYGADLTGVSKEFFDRLLSIEENNTRNIEHGWKGLVTWEFDGPVPIDGVSIEEFLRGCKGIEIVRKMSRGKKMFGV